MSASDSLLSQRQAFGNSVPKALIGSSLYFLVIWLLNASLVPGINESHYLPKAKHAWNQAYAPGDLFLASGNAHWLFAQIAGWLTTWLPLSGVAWTGRLFAWIAMAYAWHRCSLRFGFSKLVASFVLAGWILAVRYGNWAGEWAVGGFEAKALAYPFVILALAELVANKWSRVWVLTGLGIAFHPLVGGWAGVTFVLSWLIFGRHEYPLRTQWFPGAVGLVISMIGIVPALKMIGGPARSGDIVVAQIHAFYRLAHHQSPRLFSNSQHLAGGVSLAVLMIATTLWFTRSRHRPVQSSAKCAPVCDAAISKLLVVAWLSLAISLCGLIIDIAGIYVRPDVAASLLRFYWFRWSDVIVPLASLASLWTWSLRATDSGAANFRSNASRFPKLGVGALSFLIVASVAAMASHVLNQWNSDVAPADRTLLMSGNADLASGPEVVVQWQAVCRWIDENTSADAVCFTPRAQQTFKWYAGRAEVVTFKDVPQDSQSLLEWFDRIGRCAPPRSPDGRPLGWTTKQLQRLHSRYHFQYVIVDRRIQLQPPLLEIVYPLGSESNATFAVFRLGDIPTQTTRTH